MKLAITKVGDLLLDEKITTDGQGNEIDGVKLHIPDYQRPYKWLAANATQLLDDILEAAASNKETYRVGTLILHENNGKYDIVDGQQRTITFALLFKELDMDVKFLNCEVELSSDTIANLKRNFCAMKRRLCGFDEKERLKLKLLDYAKNNCELVVVITDDLSEAFQFFDSQNARGKPLYPHDLLKAYHLREMGDLPQETVDKTVAQWEGMDQTKLARLFSEYLHSIKEWINGNWAHVFTERDIGKFKGIRRSDDFPFAQFYKGAFAYATTVNVSSVPFVSGMHELKPFQIDSPIIAGKPFFDYAKHYFDVLADIRDNDKYAGFFINDNKIVETLDMYFTVGTGNGIARFMFDSAVLLYVDRFCPSRPSKQDTVLLDRFVVQAFVWAYSLRAQYVNLGWHSAQNYILGRNGAELVNSFNIYKLIAESFSPVALFTALADRMRQLPRKRIRRPWKEEPWDGHSVRKHYLDFFKEYGFIETDAKEA